STVIVIFSPGWAPVTPSLMPSLRKSSELISVGSMDRACLAAAGSFLSSDPGLAGPVDSDDWPSDCSSSEAPESSVSSSVSGALPSGVSALSSSSAFASSSDFASLSDEPSSSALASTSDAPSSSDLASSPVGCLAGHGFRRLARFLSSSDFDGLAVLDSEGFSVSFSVGFDVSVSAGFSDRVSDSVGGSEGVSDADSEESPSSAGAVVVSQSSLPAGSSTSESSETTSKVTFEESVSDLRSVR